MKHSFSFGLPKLVQAGGTSSSDKLLPLFDSSQILSHRRGFGTRITAECLNELWVNLDPCWYFLWRATESEIFSMSDCPDLSPRMLPLSSDTSANYPEASYGGCCVPQEHLARGGRINTSVILFWMWWVTLLWSQKHTFNQTFNRFQLCFFLHSCFPPWYVK